MDQAGAHSQAKPKGWARTLLPVAALIGALVLFFALDLDRHVSLEALRAGHGQLDAWTAAHPLAAPLAFALICAGLMAIAFPSVGVLMIAGGYLFGYPGAALTALSASLGGTVFFIAARSAAGAALRARFARAIEALREGFQRNAFTYLLSLRFLPVMPFVLTSLAGAASGMRAGPFFLATFIGSLPAALVYGSIGMGARAVFASGGHLSIGQALAQPPMLAALIGMAALSAATFFLRARKT